MISALLLFFGPLIVLLGLVVRLAPGLDRPKRLFLYRWLPFTRDLYRVRANTEKGRTPDYFEDKWVIREVLDVIGSELPYDLPDRKVVAVTPVAADIKLHFTDDDQSYPIGIQSHQFFESVLSDAMASKCRWYGLIMGGLGMLLSLVGGLLSL
jgi:hypothetical protein